MTKKIQLLSVILVAQLAISAALMVSGDDTGAFLSGDKLINLELSKLDTITIEEKDKPALILEKQGEHWQLPNYFNFPVDTDKLEKVSGKIFEIKKSWPVATTTPAAKRFKVAEDEFERKIVFKNGGSVLETLLIGSAPSYRKVHARLNGDNEIYAITFSSFEAGSKPQEWASKSFLHVNNDDFAELNWPAFTLKRESENLVITDLKPNEASDEIKIRGLVNKLANLSFSEVLGKKDQPEYQQNSPVLELQMTDKSGAKSAYIFSKFKDSQDYVLKRSNSEYYFKLASYMTDGLVDASRKKLLTEETEQNKDQDGKPAVEEITQIKAK